MKRTDPLTSAASLLGKKGGRVRSEAKAAAARENGKKGGRPKRKRHIAAKLLILACVLAGCASPTAPQAASTLKVQVVGHTTHIPLPNIPVSLESCDDCKVAHWRHSRRPIPNNAIMTDADGRATLPILLNSIYLLRVGQWESIQLLDINTRIMWVEVFELDPPSHIATSRQ